MILAEKITEERKKNGWSQEELANQLGVSRQAVSKWESAGSIPDIQKVIQLADLFGVSTDYLLKEDMLPEQTLPVAYDEGGNMIPLENEVPLRRVSMEESNNFLEMRKKTAPRFANATALCILSPVLLIILGAMSEENMFHVTEGLAAGLGCTVLFILIAVAVFSFITNGMREARWDFLNKEVFETEYGVSGMVKEKKYAYEGTFTRGIALGVVLCILAVVPLIIAGAMGAPDYICGIFVGMLLIMIAVGVNMIIRVSIIRGSFDALLQEGDYTMGQKRLSSKKELLSKIYWSLATAIYLAWSFWTMRWDFTWIIWPVAGVLFAAVNGIMRLMAGDYR